MYENLIETLRFCAKNGDCHDCPYEKPCAGTMGEGLYCEAADAIEELQQVVEQMKAIVIAEAQHTEMFDERDKKTLIEMAKSLPLPESPKEGT